MIFWFFGFMFFCFYAVDSGSPRRDLVSYGGVLARMGDLTSVSTVEALARQAKDIHLLEDLLRQTIGRLAGSDVLTRFDQIREAANDLRSKGAADAARFLREHLDSLDVSALRELIRAFGIYFDLNNLAEQHARIRAIRRRILRQHPTPMTESAAEALGQLKERGFPAAKLQHLLHHLRICPVFTAHPSEARRLTILEKLGLISKELDRLDYQELLPQEIDAVHENMRQQIEILWLTEGVRAERPGVIDEVRQGLEVVEGTLFEVVPDLYRELETRLKSVYPDHPWILPPVLRFGSWIGGDRDGHPDVNSKVTTEAVKLHQTALLGHYRAQVQDLGQHLSHSGQRLRLSQAFRESLEAEAAALEISTRRLQREPFRQKCTHIARKLDLTIAHIGSLATGWTDPPPPAKHGVYLKVEQFLADLNQLAAELLANRADAATRMLAKLARKVEVFGFHLMTLDIRQHADRHRQAMAEVLAHAGIERNYLHLNTEERIELLAEQLSKPRPVIPAHLGYSANTNETIRTFRAISVILEHHCPTAIENYIISGTEDAANLLEVLLLAREARLFRSADGISRINIIPLFETLGALGQGREILERLLEVPAWREHLILRGDLQEVMIGYSDSNKESGFVQSAWSLHEIQRSLAAFAKQSGLTIRIFHGRGGAVGRGGGPANHAILAQPPGSVNGALRITEQGEVIADRYGHKAIAMRHLDQILNASIRASLGLDLDKPEAAWETLMDRLAETAREHYRGLVYEDPSFLSYFNQATPINEISQLRLGSRPARRGTATAIEQLRAIPWVFSWMQSRHTLPGWYGLGSAIREVCLEVPGAEADLRRMYQDWAFFRALIDNAQMILAKADMNIARLYADLVEDGETGRKIFTRIETEFHRTVEGILSITGQSALLEKMPILRDSIARRNPYVDPLSFIQLVLLRRLRRGESDTPGLLEAVLESINGIASGLKNTG